MKHFPIARPYAVAAFEFAQSASSVDSWLSALAAMQAVIGEPAVTHLIAHPEVSAPQIESVLVEVLKGSCNEAQLNFLRLLIENKRLMVIEEILVLFKEHLAEAHQTVQATLSSVAPVDDATKAAIQKALEQKFEQRIELETAIDESLIGGALIRSADWVIDASVKGRLKQMAKALIEKG